ncbi:hypothetical protein LCGC14_1337060 [marine sediment metagenome]|uniref:Uncharacterized protein n=1 Tax=marine sediment metagenome TaxID=412755 RepID=A0A0F9MVM6_9ZZZZ
MAKKKRTLASIKKEEKDNINKKWKISTCHEGAKCWCRIISTVDATSKDEGFENCIVPSGSIYKEYAQYIVKIHNEWLKNEK